jgi:hypothetical protein
MELVREFCTHRLPVAIFGSLKFLVKVGCHRSGLWKKVKIPTLSQDTREGWGARRVGTLQELARLTSAICCTTFNVSWGGGDNVRRRLRSILALFLLGTATCVFALPRVDLPETAFNEADTPVNVAPPVRPGIRVIPPAVDPIAVLPKLPSHCATCLVRGKVHESAAVARQRHQHSLQDLLCTFLI